MRYALMIALTVVACKKTEERRTERIDRTGETPSTTEPSTTPSAPPSGAARTTTAPQRGAERADESMRPDSVIPKPVAIRVADAKFVDGPDALPKGAKISVLEGEPPFKTEKTFTMLLKLPKNYTIAPHTHLVTERVTVLEGSLLFGHGEKMDRSSAIKVDAGGLIVIPQGHVHYALTGDQEVTIALTGIGPWEIIYVNPKDDPRPTPARLPAKPFVSKWEAQTDAKVFLANDVSFQAPRQGGMPPGVKMAVLEGDPTQAKTFVVRFLFPKGTQIAPYAPAHSERLFVVSGALKLGFGENADAAKAQSLPAPSVAIVPSDLQHFARADQDTVVQVFGVGPLESMTDASKQQRAPATR